MQNEAGDTEDNTLSSVTAVEVLPEEIEITSKTSNILVFKLKIQKVKRWIINEIITIITEFKFLYQKLPITIQKFGGMTLWRHDPQKKVFL
jgi:hypothetical protein